MNGIKGSVSVGSITVIETKDHFLSKYPFF